jgi:hypothetical protein
MPRERSRAVEAGHSWRVWRVSRDVEAAHSWRVWIACCGSWTLLAGVAMTDGEPVRHLISSLLPDGSRDRIEK